MPTNGRVVEFAQYKVPITGMGSHTNDTLRRIIRRGDHPPAKYSQKPRSQVFQCIAAPILLIETDILLQLRLYSLYFFVIFSLEVCIKLPYQLRIFAPSGAPILAIVSSCKSTTRLSNSSRAASSSSFASREIKRISSIRKSVISLIPFLSLRRDAIVLFVYINYYCTTILPNL